METFDPAADPRAFRSALGAFATGVTVVTARGPDGRPAGITANSFASVSLDPALVLWSPARASRRFSIFTAAESFVIHVLGHDQQAVCDAFVRSDQGFDAIPVVDGPGGVPLIGGCLARFVCDREQVIEAGDHAIVLGRVREALRREGTPLVFQGGRYGSFRPATEGHPAPEAEG